MTKVEIVVGRDLRSAADEVAEAWKAAAAGGEPMPSDRIVFRDWATLCAVLTPARFTVLRMLHGMPGTTLASLADAVGRSAADVRGDITSLAQIGLIDEDGTGALSTVVDEITSTIRIAA